MLTGHSFVQIQSPFVKVVHRIEEVCLFSLHQPEFLWGWAVKQAYSPISSESSLLLIFCKTTRK